MYNDYQNFQFETIESCVNDFKENQKLTIDYSDMDCTILLAKRIITSAEEIIRDCNNKQIVEMLKTQSPFKEG